MILTRIIQLKLKVNKQQSKQLLEFVQNTHNATNLASQLILPYVQKHPEMIKEAGVTNKKGQSKFYTFNIWDLLTGRPKSKHITWLTDKEKQHIKDGFNNICNTYNILNKPKVYRNMIAKNIMCQYKGNFKRHDNKTASNVKSHKAFRNGYQAFQLKEQNNQWCLNIPGILECKIEVLNKKYEKFLGKTYDEKKSTYVKKLNPGGNLEYNKGIFIYKATIQIEVKDKYTPISSLGIDVNKTKETWLALSNGKFVERNQSLQNAIDKKNEILPFTDKKKKLVKSRQRNIYWKRLKNANLNIKKEVTSFAQSIINEAQNNNLLIAIDGAQPGKNMGEYGQCFNIKLLELCENQGIPHQVVPSPYTSRSCSKCGDKSKKNRTKQDKFKCTNPNCGYANHADTNAAINIANIAWDMYTGKLLTKK